MARARSPERLRAEQMYLECKGNIDLVDIANELGRPPGTVRGWKNKDNWDDKLNGTFQKKSKNTERSDRKRNVEKEVKIESNNIDKELVDKVMENEDLSEQRRLFCIYYIEDFNATKAYQKAYGCSRDTARTNGSRLLTNANIKVEIDRLTDECLEEEGINSKLLAKRVFQKHIDIALADITDYTEFGAEDVPVISKVTGEQLKDENGEPITYKSNYVHFKNSGEIDGSLITEVSQGKDGVKVKLADRMRALQWLSDRMDLLSTADRERLRMAQEKLDHERNSDTVGEINVNIVSKE